MAVTRLERKGRKNKNVAKNRVDTMKRLNATPPIKNVDIEAIKEEFAKQGKKEEPKAKKAATKKEKDAPKAEEAKKTAPKAKAAKKEDAPKAEAAEEKKAAAPKKKAAPKAKKKEETAAEDKKEGEE